MESAYGNLGIYFVPSDGFQWADFLSGKLEEDGYNIKSTLIDVTLGNQSTLCETNVLLVSPDFLHLDSLKSLVDINAQRALMVLLGTQAVDVRKMLIQHKLVDFLQNITFFEASATEYSVRSLLIGIIKLYEHVHGAFMNEEQEQDQQEKYDYLPTRRPSELESVQQVNMIKNVAVSYGETKREVYILCDRKGSDEIEVKLDDEEGHLKAIYENKVIYRFELDNSKPKRHLKFTAKDGDVTVGTAVIDSPKTEKTYKADNSSKFETLREILGVEKDPICLMCKALNLSEFSREALDENLAFKCKSVEPIRRLEGALRATDKSSKGHSNETWPTLIHFAASYNLHQFCKELLKFDGSVEESYVMNKDNETPLDIARRLQFHEITHLLRNGNKDSGVIEDDFQSSLSPSDLHPSESYADMSGITELPIPPSGIPSSESYTDMSKIDESPKLPSKSLSSKSDANMTKIGESVKLPTRRLSSDSYTDMSKIDESVKLASKRLSSESYTDMSKIDESVKLPSKRLSSESYTDMSKIDESVKLPSKRLSSESYTDMSKIDESVKLPSKILSSESYTDMSKIDESPKLPSELTSSGSYADMSQVNDMPKLPTKRLSSDSYADMSGMTELPKLPIRSSTISLDDLPPPAPHTNTYMNVSNIKREEAHKTSHPVTQSRVSFHADGNEADRNSDYLDMSGEPATNSANSPPNFHSHEIHRSQSDSAKTPTKGHRQDEINRSQSDHPQRPTNGHGNNEMHRSQSDNARRPTSGNGDNTHHPQWTNNGRPPSNHGHTVHQSQWSSNSRPSSSHEQRQMHQSQSTNNTEHYLSHRHDEAHRKSTGSGDDGPDADYEVPVDIDEECPRSDNRNSITSSISLHFAGSQEDIQLPKKAHRHSGFFKKFKLFKHTKKEEKAPRGRKMSLPNESDVAAFQKQNSHLFRRASVQHGPKSSGNLNHSNTDLNIEASINESSSEEKQNNKKQHFLHETKRRSFRVNKAINDSINPLPLP